MNNLNHTGIFFRNGYSSIGLKDSNPKNIIPLFIFLLNKLYFYDFCCLVVLKDDLSPAFNKILAFFCSSVIIFYFLSRILARNYSITTVSSNYCQLDIFMRFRCLNKCFLKTNDSWIVIVDDCDCALYIISF